MQDEYDVQCLLDTIEDQRALLSLAIELLEGLGFDLDEFAGATVD